MPRATGDPGGKRRRGVGRAFTLAETVFSTFLLAAAFLIVVSAFHASVYRTSRIEKMALASLLAGEALEEVRSLDYDAWRSFTGRDGPHPDFPEYRVTVTTDIVEMLSPVSSFELAWPPADDPLNPLKQRRILEESMKWVRVEVSWGRGASDRVARSSFVREPPRRVPDANALVVSPVGGSAPSPVPRYDPTSPTPQTVDFEAHLFDEDGAEIRDVFFLWYVGPRDGNGTILSQTRDGARATFANYVVIPGASPPYGHTGGTCTVTARARYRGKEISGDSELLLLD